MFALLHPPSQPRLTGMLCGYLALLYFYQMKSLNSAVVTAPRKQYLYYCNYYRCMLSKKTALGLNVAVLISSVSYVNCITSLSVTSDTSQLSHYLYDVHTLLFWMPLVSYYYITEYDSDDHLSLFISCIPSCIPVYFHSYTSNSLVFSTA